MVCGWFGSTQEEDVADAEESVSKELTQEERDELHIAIAQDDSFRRPPKHYVMTRISVKLNKGKISLVDDTGVKPQPLISFRYSTAVAEIEQRPSAEAFKLSMSLDSFTVRDDVSLRTNTRTLIGRYQEEEKEGTGEEALFKFVFETNPLNELADSFLMLKTNYLDIYYNKYVVEQCIAFFNPPENAHLEEVQSAALSITRRFENFNASWALNM